MSDTEKLPSIADLIDAGEYDKAAHLFYGLHPDLYDAGMRLDFKNATSEVQRDGTLRITYPVLRSDGQPLTIRTEGILVQKVKTE